MADSQAEAPEEQTYSKKTKRRAFVCAHYSWTDQLREKFETGNQIKYYCGGHEICPKTGRKHFQLYVYFFNAKTLAQACKYIGNKVLFAQGSPDENTAYSSKDGDFIEWGEKPRPGKRTDLVEIRKAMLEDGESLRTVVQKKCANFQELRYAECLARYIAPKIVERNIRWFWGPSGTGKSHRAYEEALKITGGDLAEIWTSGKDLNWYEGYTDQECAILDEFRGDFCKFHQFLRLTDKFPMRVQIKGSSAPFVASEIWVTSPKPPELTWDKSGEELKQLLRRISEIREFRTVYKDVREPRRTVDQGEGEAPTAADTDTAVGGNRGPPTGFDLCASDDEAECIPRRRK